MPAPAALPEPVVAAAVEKLAAEIRRQLDPPEYFAHTGPETVDVEGVVNLRDCILAIAPLIRAAA